MARHDLESLLTPLADEAPSGPDLEYDADFQTLERTATPKAERAIGDSVKTAEEPDWDKVSSLGEALLGRSRDHAVNAFATASLGVTEPSIQYHCRATSSLPSRVCSTVIGTVCWRPSIVIATLPVRTTFQTGSRLPTSLFSELTSLRSKRWSR